MVDAVLFEFDGTVADTHATMRTASVPMLAEQTLGLTDTRTAGGRTMHR